MATVPRTTTTTATTSTSTSASTTDVRLTLRHPVLRDLSVATVVSTVGRGVFFTLSAIYFTSVIGLSPATVGLGLTTAGAIGIGAALLGGHLADRYGPRHVLVVAVAGQGVALIAYTAVRDVVWFIVVASVVSAGYQCSTAARSALVAGSFSETDRVGARARLRVVTNIGISAGAGLGGLALALDSPAADRWIMAAAGMAYLASVPVLLRIPEPAELREAAAAPAGPGNPAVAPSVAAAGRPPMRDRRYLATAGLAGLCTIQFSLFEVGVPLWVVQSTQAPAAVVSALLLTNTVFVIVFQVPLAARAGTIRAAGRTGLVAGAAMATACALYVVAGLPTAAVGAAVVLFTAAIAHSVGEVLFSASTWTLGFDLADPRRAGAYQGVFTMGGAVGAMIGPLVVTTTAVEHGGPGWAALAVLFAATGAGLALVSRTAPSHLRPAV